MKSIEIQLKYTIGFYSRLVSIVKFFHIIEHKNSLLLNIEDNTSKGSREIVLLSYIKYRNEEQLLNLYYKNIENFNNKQYNTTIKYIIIRYEEV
jgi:hypothetical protein